MPPKLPNDLRLTTSGNQAISRKPGNFIENCLLLRPPPEMKILSVLVKIS